jgi:inorganic triphosphatase YgiF
MHRRAEYEWPLNRGRLDPARLAATPWAELFADTAGRLAPVFITDVVRTERPLKFEDGTRASLSFDLGAIRAPGKRSPLCEIEIELVEGDVRRLYDLALALCVDIPLALSHASKAAQGYALARPRPARPVHAGKAPFAPDVAAPRALAAVAADCLRQIGVNAESMLRGRDGEFLHQLRVGVRRMRSLLKLDTRTECAGEIALLDHGLAELGKVFGPARDWDVFTAGMLGTIAANLDDVQQRRAFRRLRLRAARRRSLYQSAARSEAGSQRFTCLLLALGRFRAGLELAVTDLPAQALARDELRRSERRLSKRGKRLRHADAAGRHRVRVAAKRLRYTAEFFAPLFRHAGAGDYIDALADLQSALGSLNDMATAGRLLGELITTGSDVELAHAAGIVRGWAAAMSARELERLPKSWRRFTKASPFWD